MILATASSSFGSIPPCECPTTSRHRQHTFELFSFNPVSNQGALEFASITRQDKRTCECFDLYKEAVPYRDAWNWQKELVREKKSKIERNEECPDAVILLQHEPVYTIGAGGSVEFLNFDIKDAPFEFYRIERGGEVTYHGPGQLVMYPIINLRNHKMDLHWYLRALEEVVIRVLSSTFSIKASRLEGLTGVWVGNQKLAAIGIKVSHWITYHGVALNVTTDLTPFNWIVPCGIRNRKVGSIKKLLGEVQLSSGCENAEIHHFDDSQLIDITRKSLIKEFSEVFQLKINHKTISSLECLEKKPESQVIGKLNN